MTENRFVGKPGVRRLLCAATIIATFAARATPAVAQMSWTGPYAGVDVGVGFRTLSFSVADHEFGSQTFKGAADPRVNISGHGGVDFLVKKRLVAGGEASVGYFGYFGEMSYGLGKDTKATTTAGYLWTAAGRAGWVFRQAMPYVSVGVLGSKNTVTTVDTCNLFPCGQELSEGSGSATATHWLITYGLQVASTKRIAGRGWAVRVEWMQVEAKPIKNDFTKTVTTRTQPGGFDAAVSANTDLSRGALRVLFDVRLMKGPK